ADSAAGYAAFSLMPADASVLTVEYKLNLKRPGIGERLSARARVIRPGRTLSVVQADVYAIAAGTESLCVTSLQTLMCLHGQPDDSGRQRA
ncbi:MAG: PaaI family thioesterase, partial [Reyranellaceae bacterium]